MTHPCFHGAPQLIDHLASLPDLTPLEECTLHTLIEVVEQRDHLCGLAQAIDRADKRFKQLITAEGERIATEHHEYRASAEATIASLRRSLAAVTRERDTLRDRLSEGATHG